MKTICITSFHTMISRNILSAGVLEHLAGEEDVRVVIVVPAHKKEYFEKTYGGKGVIIEGVPLYYASKTFRGLLFKKLAIFLFGTRSARLRKEYDYYLSGNVVRYGATILLEWVGKSNLVRRLTRALDWRLSPRGLFSPLLQKYKPDLVFSTDVQNENDVSLCFDAKRAHIPIVAMVRSWDNLSLRILRFFPDWLVVGSDELCCEAVAFNNYPREQIAVLGNPHYDRYMLGPTEDRESFLERFGLPTGKKIILYAPVSDALIRKNDVDEYVLSLLKRIPAAVLVRFPPEKPVSLSPSFEKGEYMSYDRPGFAFSGKNMGDREIRLEDDENLRNELHYADVVVTGPTSITIDAALMDKPVIAVNMYPTKRHFFETIWRYKDVHIQKLEETGGVAFVRNEKEFFEVINRYLLDPQRNALGRAEVRRRWFSCADGGSGKRIGAFLLAQLRNTKHI